MQSIQSGSLAASSRSWCVLAVLGLPGAGASDPGCVQPSCSPGRAGKAEVEFVTLPWFGSQTRRLSPCFLKYVSKPCPRYQL